MAQSRVVMQTMAYEIMALLTKIVGNFRSLAHPNFKHDLIAVLQVVPGTTACQHLQHNASNGPDVSRSSMSLDRISGEYLWSHVGWSSNKGGQFAGHRCLVLDFNAAPEVSEFHIAVGREEDVGT